MPSKSRLESCLDTSDGLVGIDVPDPASRTVMEDGASILSDPPVVRRHTGIENDVGSSQHPAMLSRGYLDGPGASFAAPLQKVNTSPEGLLSQDRFFRGTAPLPLLQIASGLTCGCPATLTFLSQQAARVKRRRCVLAGADRNGSLWRQRFRTDRSSIAHKVGLSRR